MMQIPLHFGAIYQLKLSETARQKVLESGRTMECTPIEGVIADTIFRREGTVIGSKDYFIPRLFSSTDGDIYAISGWEDNEKIASHTKQVLETSQAFTPEELDIFEMVGEEDLAREMTSDAAVDKALALISDAFSQFLQEKRFTERLQEKGIIELEIPDPPESP